MTRTKPSLCVFIVLLLALPSTLHPNEPGSSSSDIELLLREPAPEKTDAASEKILEHHVRALGGLGHIMAIQNTQSRGTLREGKETSQVTYYRAAPNLLRIESVQKHHGRATEVIRGYNGAQAWVFDKSQTHPFPAPMSASESASFIQEADFYGPIINREQQNNIFRYEGEVNSRGQKHYLLKMFDPKGKTTYFYFDAKTLLITRIGRKDSLQGTIVDYDTFYTRYQRVNGVWFPTEFEMALAGQVYGQLVLDHIQANQPMSPDLFEEPKVREVWLRQKR